MSSLLELDLSGNLLHGSLPREPGQLKSLTLLDLSNNEISQGLPQALHDMASLQDLLLSNNPESFVSMKMLRFLALDNNILSGCVPAKLADLPALTALYLNGNNLTGELKFSEEFYRRMGRRVALGFPTCSITVWLGVAVQQLLVAILFVFLL